MSGQNYGKITRSIPRYVQIPDNQEVIKLFQNILNNRWYTKDYLGVVNPFIIGKNGLVNTSLLYVDNSVASSGDGSSENPFKTVQEAMSLIPNEDKIFNIIVLPGSYNGVDVSIPDKAAVCFIGAGSPNSVIFNFKVNFKPSAVFGGGGINQCYNSNILFLGGYDIDASSATGSSVQFINGGGKIQRHDSNENLFIFINRFGILEDSFFSGTVFASDWILAGNIALNHGSRFYSSSLINMAGQVIVEMSGDSIFTTQGSVNTQDSYFFINGTTIGHDTPVWSSDFASIVKATGSVVSKAVGGAISDTFVTPDLKTAEFTYGLLTDLS